MAPETLSNLVNHCQDYVDTVISRINQQNKALRKELPKLVQDAVWIDETFFSVNGRSWALILAIDYTGQVLGCQFGKERKAAQIIEVLKQVEQNLPSWRVLIGDGARAYAPAVRSFQKDAYLLQQYHSKPWALASLSHFCPTSDGSMLEHQVQFSYRVFVEDSPQVGSVLTKKHAKRTKKVGRPKGRKTKRQKGDKTRKKAAPKKRGQKSAWNDGVAFFVGDESNFLDIRWHDGNGMESKEVVQRILWVAFMIFGGKSIVSNRIESFNSELKRAIPKEGMHTEAHILNRITRAIQLKNRSQLVQSLRSICRFLQRLA